MILLYVCKNHSLSQICLEIYNRNHPYYFWYYGRFFLSRIKACTFSIFSCGTFLLRFLSFIDLEFKHFVIYTYKEYAHHFSGNMQIIKNQFLDEKFVNNSCKSVSQLIFCVYLLIAFIEYFYCFHSQVIDVKVSERNTMVCVVARF